MYVRYISEICTFIKYSSMIVFAIMAVLNTFAGEETRKFFLTHKNFSKIIAILSMIGCVSFICTIAIK